MKIPAILCSLAARINKKSIILLGLILLFIILLNPLKDFYDDKIIKVLISQANPSWYLDVTFIMLIIVDILTVITFLYTNRKMSNALFGVMLFSFSLFFVCRYFAKSQYEFYSFTFIEQFKYADFFTVMFLSCLILKLTNWTTTNKAPADFAEPFIVDSPIKSTSKDKFSRKNFADKIAIKIQSKIHNPDAGSLALGINGPWGSGKTSFMYMIKEGLQPDNRIIIDFNPWRSSTSMKIIEDFFEVLVTELSRYDEELSSTINEYAKTLTEIDENRITKGINTISNFLFDGLDKSQSYERINKSIAKSKKQLLIFIDDLDRLDKREIVEVLRLIRNTANFNNLVYIVSYDKDYVLEAIKSFNKHNYKSFLEKIFQFEFTLPAYEESVNRETIKSLLKSQLPENFHKQIDWVLDDRPLSGLNFTNEIIRTQRDAVRLANSILFEIEPIKNEIFFYDFYLLQLLKLKYPKIYSALVDNRYKFFISGQDDKGDKIYKFRKHADLNADDDMVLMLKTNSNWNENKVEDETFEFDIYLQEAKQILDLTNYDTYIIKKLVEVVLRDKGRKEASFGSSALDKEREREAKRGFCYPRNFHKYFAFRLYEGDLSDYEFEDYRLRSFEEYLKKVLKWLEEGKYSDLKDRLAKITDFSSVEEFENHVKILVEIGHIESKENNSYYLDYSLISKALRYPILKYFGEDMEIKLYVSKEDYRNFVVSIFDNAPTPYLFESSIILRLIVSEEAFIISHNELEEINLNYFKKYLEESTAITSEFWNLYHNCRVKTINLDTDEGKNPEAIKLAINAIRKRTGECELGMFIKQTTPRSKSFSLEQNDWSFVFPTNAEFESWFSSSENINRESDCFKEFSAFYQLTKAEGFKPVVFTFQFLNPIRWN